MSIPNDIWGKHFWYTIHFIALSYPENPSELDKNDYRFFYNSLYKVLPCTLCAENYKIHLGVMPLTTDMLKHNKSLFEWTVKMHNLVNIELNKQTWTLSQAWNYYNNMKNFTPLNRKSTVPKWKCVCIYLILAISICIACHYLVSRHRKSF